MKDSEFIELLNLYLDHEISAANAARLEAEVQNNSARRRIYEEYCRMQKACKMIAADFQTDPVESTQPVERKIIAFNPAVAAAVAAQRRRATALYAMGTFAAVAACVAFIFVGRNEAQNLVAPASAQSQPVAQSASASTIPNPEATFVAGTAAAPRGLVSVAPRSQPMWVRDQLLLGNPQGETVLPAMHQASSQLDWIRAVQLTPLQQRAPSELHFAATLQTERALGTRAAPPPKQPQPGDELVGFQFGK